MPLLVKLAVLGAALLAIWWLAFSSPESPPEAEDFAAAPSPAPPAQVLAGAPGAQQPAPTREPSTEPAMANTQAPAQPSATQAPSSETTATAPQRQGPVEELAQRFASESRGSSSEQEESRVKTAFVDPQIPSALLDSVECRRSVCRLRLRWSAAHDQGYVLGLTRAAGSFSAPLGIDEPGPADAQGQRPLVVFMGLLR